MQNDENTLDTQEVNQESEADTVEATADATTSTDATQSVATEDSVEARLAKAESEAAKYRRLFEKTQKPQASTPVAPQKASPHNVEEAVLLAQGMPDELLTSLKKVAQVEGLGSLIKAQTNPIFIAVKEKFEREQKQKESSLGASRGSGQVKAPKDFKTPGLTREEHKRMTLENLS